MVYKVMQDLACTGAARGVGAAQEQRPVGRPSINQYLLAQPSPPSYHQQEKDRGERRVERKEMLAFLSSWNPCLQARLQLT